MRPTIPTRCALALSLLLVLVLGACRRQGPTEPEPTVAYLSTIIADGSESALRAQTEHSINQDLRDFEDKVTQLAVYVFPAGRGDLSAFYYINNPNGVHHRIPPMKITSGLNDIYFIANAGENAEATLRSLVTRPQVDEYLKSLRPYAGSASPKFAAAPYFQITSTDRGLPMSRVYRGVYVPHGEHTSPATAFNFLPSNQSQEPVTDGLDGMDRKVGLVRSVAKLTVTFTGPNIKDLSYFYLFGMPKQVGLMQVPERSIAEYGTSDRIRIQVSDPVLNGYKKLDVVNNTATMVFYLPERLLAPNAVTWREPAQNLEVYDPALNGIAYIMMKKRRGAAFFLPIVHASEADLRSTDYADLAKGKVSGKAPDYSIRRNRHYHLTITVPDDPKDLLVTDYKIKPWDHLPSIKDFSKIEVMNESSVEGGNNKGVYKYERNYLRLNSYETNKVDLYFTIKQPSGSVWNFTIDNAIDFGMKVYDISGGRPGTLLNGYSGVVKDRNTPAKLRIEITALKPFTGENKYTELYLTVNGKEVQIVKDWLTDTSKASAGPGNRYRIVQTQVITE